MEIKQFNLTNDTRPEDPQRIETFVGFVNQLNEEDNTLITPVLEYAVNPYISLTLGYERVSASTLNFNNNLGDGTATLEGPAIGIRAQYPITPQLLPFAGITYAIYGADFDHERWWTYGYASPEAYLNAGSPDGTLNANRRYIDITDENSVILQLGLTYLFSEKVSVKLQYQTTEVTTTAQTYTGSVNNRIPGIDGEFTLDYYTVGLSVLYTF
jgi:long-subunit fatty acid transport protein